MIEVKLKPILDKHSYSNPIWEKIRYELWIEIFKPIFDILSIKNVNNAVGTALIYALEVGTIQYKDGYFRGKFNAGVGLDLRKIGAKFVINKKSYKLDQSFLPSQILASLHLGQYRIEEKIQKIEKYLNDLEKYKSHINFEPYFKAMVRALDIAAKRTIPSDFEVPMTLSPSVEKALEEDYTKNLNLYIQKWKSDAILRLRQQVHENVASGFRADALADRIQYEYGVSDRKAKFLARQETSLLISKYREHRYGEIGIVEYIWSTSHDSRVRPAVGSHGETNNHRVLDGRRFRFDDPPTVDPARGRRANPGEDYGCRCTAIPIFRRS